MKKVKALLISALVPLVMFWAFNFAGFHSSFTYTQWYYWIPINVLFALTASGLMAWLFVYARRVRSQYPSYNRVYKKIKILCIVAFVILPVGILFNICSCAHNSTARLVFTLLNLFIVGTLLGLTIYATVKVFKFRLPRNTTTTTTTTTVKK